MPYGTIKVDNIIYTKGGVDTTLTVSGIVDSLSGAISVTGAISGASVSAATGTFTTLSGNTTAGTTATFTSGVFTTFSGTTVNVVSGVFASGTVALPSVSVGTSGNGLYSPGTNQVGISTSGNGRLTVDSAGNVSVDGSTVYIDAANNRVGLGTASPTSLLHLVTSSSSGSSNTDGVRINSGGNVAINIGSNSTTGYGWIQSADWGTGYISTAINPNGGNVGIGTPAPGYLLDVVGTGSQTAAIRTGTSGDPKLYLEAAGTNAGFVQYSRSSQALQLSGQNPTVHATLDASGNLGLGVTPGVWSAGKAIQVGSVAVSLWGVSGQTVLMNNAYYNSGDKYATTGAASYYLQAAGAHKWFTAPSWNGTGSDVITFTQAMTLDASGNLGIGETSPTNRLHVKGTQNTVYSPNDTLAGGVLAYFKNASTTNSTDATIRLEATGSGNIAAASLSAVHTGDGSSAFTVGTRNAGGSVTECARIDSSGRLLVGTASDSGGALLQVNGDRIRVATAKTPASATATGTAGEVCWDANYIYVCTATNTWKRAAIATW